VKPLKISNLGIENHPAQDSSMIKKIKGTRVGDFLVQTGFA
jgi:hypothetical protein